MLKKWLIPSILAAAMLLPSVSNAAASATFTFTTEDGGEGTGPALIKYGTTYVTAGHWEAAGLEASWDSSHQRVTFAGWEKSISIRLGSKVGVLDGKKVDLGGEPFEYEQQLYIPARFLVQSLGGQSVSWDAKQSVYKAKGLQTYASASAKFGGLTYTVNKKLGQLYVTDVKGKSRLLANLGSKLYDMVHLDFFKTPAGLIYLTITDVYGEPHINNKWFTLVIKNGMVIRQASVGYHYRFGNNIKMYSNQLLLTNGKTLRLIEDGTGKITQTIDLTQLGGRNDDYLIEGMDKDFILIRANQDGILTLVNRAAGTKTLLYKVLLDKEQQEYAETNDIPYYGDNLRFLKREGDTLFFKNETPLFKDQKVYKYKLAGIQ